MPYVQRNDAGRIIAASTEALDGFELVSSESPEFIEFGRGLSQVRAQLHESDLEVIRVLDDLVNVLVQKNLIRFTDLPEAAQQKLMERRGLRENAAALRLFDDDVRVI